ncbi:MAG: NUDIX hydrolase [Nitriliruptoraceae bacterium]|nr:NUDIX hydrolase [Nitriliruptoraceae bacterium]
MSDTAWFETVGRRTVYEGRIDVRVDAVTTPDGDTMEREIAVALDAVGIVPIDERGRVLLLRQYRQPVGAYLLEIPAGVRDVEGEEPTETARRELHEETSHEADVIEPLTAIWNSAGWSTERTHLFLATGCRVVDPVEGFVPKAEEADMELLALPLEAAIAAVEGGEIVDAKSVVGLLLAAARLG